jgi:ribonucleotide reductase beta subunit family protein with ferritin-like domain
VEFSHPAQAHLLGTLSSINTAGDYQDVFELNRKAHTGVMMTIFCDRGTHLGVMAKKIMDNFAWEVKPQQLCHFFNLHICNMDNIDLLFYQHYCENVLMQQPADFLHLNLVVYSPESIKQKHDWIQKWTKTEHRTFAEHFVAFMAATLIFDTVNYCTADAFKNNGILHGLVEGIRLMENHTEVLKDFCNFVAVHNDLLIRTASPLMIREIVYDAAEYELNYAVAITPEENSFLEHFLLFKHIKKNH